MKHSDVSNSEVGELSKKCQQLIFGHWQLALVDFGHLLTRRLNDIASGRVQEALRELLGNLSSVRVGIQKKAWRLGFLKVQTFQ